MITINVEGFDDNSDMHFAVLCAEIGRLRACIDYLKFLAHRGDHNEDLYDFGAIWSHCEDILSPDNSILENQPEEVGDVFYEMGLWPHRMEEKNLRLNGEVQGDRLREIARTTECYKQAKAEERQRILGVVEKRMDHLSQLIGTSVADPVILALKTRRKEAEAIRNQIQEANDEKQ